MTTSLYELLNRDIKKMIFGTGRSEYGNIYPLIIKEIEKYIIEITLRETSYNYFRTARILGISRSTLYRKIEKLNISRSNTKKNQYKQ